MEFETLKWLFIAGFCLHNLEEAIWLPAWSRHAARYYEPVETKSFWFAVSIVTLVGILLAGIDSGMAGAGSVGAVVRLAFVGFAAMMGLNAFLPHLVATIALRRYAPGLATAFAFNLPLAILILMQAMTFGLPLVSLIFATLGITLAVLASLKPLFLIGEKLFPTIV